MLRPLLVATLFLLWTPRLWAHPGTGIVLDRQGNVFYTDLTHVWRIAPDGRRKIAVRDVHTHELAIDTLGNLYGEDSEYLGGDRYRHRIWRRAPDGRITDVIPWTAGFWSNYGFARDAQGNGYYTHCPEQRCEIRRRAPDGRITRVAPASRFRHPFQWIAAAPDGTLHAVIDGGITRISPDGRFHRLASGLGEHPMGLTVDSTGVIHIAVSGARTVVRIAPDGRTRVVARSAAPWAPSGVARAPDGTLWILEYSTSNTARVRRLRPNGRVTIFD